MARVYLELLKERCGTDEIQSSYHRHRLSSTSDELRTDDDGSLIEGLEHDDEEETSGNSTTDFEVMLAKVVDSLRTNFDELGLLQQQVEV
ncbi:hypothetical protein R1flu_009688 [Riccia fluitans]|uniref:Uncharacterized protein n=1 Tax=Riccia fluitans TaxID=41844 RepID=A0ABD1Z2U8_9MARC